MKTLTYEEFLALKTENISAILKEGNKITALYTLEEWDDCPYDNNFFRVLEYGDLFIKNDWTLDNEDLSSLGLIHSISEQQGRYAGGIYFYYENEGERALYENANACLYSLVHDQVCSKICILLSIVSMTEAEWREKWMDLGDEVYIVVIED